MNKVQSRMNKLSVTISYSDDSVGNNTTFVTDLRYVPVEVFAVITRTSPSFPGCVSTTLARGHLVGIMLSSRRMTMSPTRMFVE